MNFPEWLGLVTARSPLAVGDSAPDVSSHDEEGGAVKLSDFYHDGFTFVYFYPKADTPGCTAQACSLRDDFVELQARGVKILGVSSDKPTLQLRFKKKFLLPFTLLADQDHAVARAFGVRLIVGLPRRQSYLIKGGKIVWRDLHASTSRQARDVVRALDEMGH